MQAIVQDLIRYFSSEGASKIDFKRAVPLLQGLHVLFNRKMGFLMRDSEHVLKSMSTPVELIKIEGGQDERVPRAPNGTKRRDPDAPARFRAGR